MDFSSKITVTIQSGVVCNGRAIQTFGGGPLPGGAIYFRQTADALTADQAQVGVLFV